MRQTTLIAAAISILLGFSPVLAQGESCVELSDGDQRCAPSQSSGAAQSDDPLLSDRARFDPSADQQAAESAQSSQNAPTSEQTAARNAQPRTAPSRDRLDLYVGGFFPVGKVEETEINFDPGFNLGAAYTHFVSDWLGIGLFADGDIFKTEDVAYIDNNGRIYVGDVRVMSLLFGGQIMLQARDGIDSGYAALKLGGGSATETLRFSGLSDKSSSGSNLGFILELGVRRKISGAIDLNAHIKYKYFDVKINDDKLDLCGVSAGIGIGAAF